MYSENVKKIAAIHDLSGTGRTSLMAVIPILSTMGFEVCPLPTAILSGHTQYPHFYMLDLTEEMPKIIAQWKEMKIRFDAIYTGYLGSPGQITIVKEFIETFRQENNLVVIDPVLGDNGKLYKTFDNQMVTQMQSLIQKADVVTPNMTELFYLLGKSYSQHNSDQTLKQYLVELSDKGPQIVIVTSVPVEKDANTTCVYAYNREGERFWKIGCPYYPAHYPGTGDTFTSVITGALMQGDSLPVAMDRAVQFISQGIRATFGYEYNQMDGILLENVLLTLNIPVQISNYEMI